MEQPRQGKTPMTFTHAVAMTAVGVVGVIVAFWILSSLAGIIFFFVKVAVIVALIAGVFWLVSRVPALGAGPARSRVPAEAEGGERRPLGWPPARGTHAAAWPSGLGRGLQSPVRRFDSARRLFLFVLVSGIDHDRTVF